MKTQPTPLYAIDRHQRAYQVIGWGEVHGGSLIPIVVRLGTFSQPRACTGDLSYMPEVPVTPPVTPVDAQTEIIQRMAGWPDPIAQPNYRDR
jgi:hypothetical protein